MRVRPEWKRVGNYMVARRTVDLRIANRERWAEHVERVTGRRISSKTIGNIERGQHWGGPETMAALEAALGWTPGDSERIATDESAEPRVINTPSPLPVSDGSLSLVLTASIDDPAFWVALRDGVSPDIFQALWGQYQELQEARRRLAERSRADGKS